MNHGFFSEEKVSEIRDRASLVEVVSDYVSLKKAGKNYKGLCPFHSEKTPSFMVNEEKQIFHCFGCGEGGDVFAFLMKVAHLSFPQAIKELAERYGVKLPSKEFSPAQKKELAKREALFQINQVTSEYFHDLLTVRKEGGEARRYLSERGIREEILREHRLGYSLDRWDGLVQHLRERKVSLELAWELGLIFPKKKEGWYDAFRGRIIFPIFDLHQRVVGFGGRVIGGGEPKYYNSPESSIYHKGEILYGLQVARRYIPSKDCVIIVEGYFDLLTLHQHGFKHGVATLGTALTTQHIRTLKRYTRNLITIFDADPAGVQASLRSLPLFLEEEVSGKTMLLPKGEDPDSFLRKGKADELERGIAEAVPLMDFFFEHLMKTYDAKSIDGKVRIAEEGVALIRKIPDVIRKDFYLRTLAECLDLKESLLHDMVRRTLKRPIRSGEDLKSPSVEKDLPKSEETLVRLMIQHPESIARVAREEIFQEFESPILRKMAEHLLNLYQKKGRLDLSEALGSIEEGLQGKLREFSLQESGLEGSDQEKVVRDCIQKIRKKRLKKDESDLLKKIKEAERQKGEKALEALLLQRQELARRERGF
ncbi:MAG: DNA primase [Thermodesulfobacteriota bacterium]